MKMTRKSRFKRLLTSISVRNFRAFESQRIRLAPITIIVGPNNAGKSSILSAARILSQTVRSVDWEVPLLLGEFGTFRDVVYGNKPNRLLGIRLGIQTSTARGAFEVAFKYRAQRREIVLRDFTLYDEKDQVLLETQYAAGSQRQIVRAIAGLDQERARALRLGFFHFLPRPHLFRYEVDRYRKDKKFAPIRRKLIEADDLIQQALYLLSSTQYLGPFREAPARLYPFSGERATLLTPSGKGATDMLVADFFRRGRGKRELSNLVRLWLWQSKIASDLQIGATSDRHYDIQLEHPITGELENLADVGYGASQILPILVAGYSLPSDSLFLVEQPEIHLHPLAQSELGEFFLHLYQRGVQCMIETHSEHLITRIQRHVGEGHIPPEDVAINYVTAGPEGKEVIEMRLNQNGVFEHGWPKGFFDQRLQEAVALAEAPLKRSGAIG